MLICLSECSADNTLMSLLSSVIFLRSDTNQPKANKRFLSSIIRHTDDHNKAILKAQADAALEAKRERQEQEREERRARAAEATEAERERRRAGGSLRREGTWDRRRIRSVSGDRSDHERHHESGSGKRRRRRSRSRSPSRRDNDREKRRRHHKERHRDEDDYDRNRSHRRHRVRSKSHSPEHDEHDGHSSMRKEKRSHNGNESGECADHQSRSKGKGRETPSGTEIPLSTPSKTGNDTHADSRDATPKSDTLAGLLSSRQSRKPSPFDLSSQFESRKARAASPPPPASPTLSEEEDIERLKPRRHARQRPSPSPRVPTEELSSKMDKYFEQSYDPRLDTGPMIMPEVPATGLIEGAEFESWDAMLDIIRQRREDKAERKRLERAGLIPSGSSKTKEKTFTDSGAWTMDAGTSVMDIKYSKRGAVREWDMGKEGF